MENKLEQNQEQDKEGLLGGYMENSVRKQW